jgi:transposase
MRKGHNGLASLVTHEMNLDLLSGAIFLFAGRNRRSAKALMWDGTGLLLIHKKLESGRFMSFRNLNEIEEVSETELSLILEGCRIKLPLSTPKVELDLKF